MYLIVITNSFSSFLRNGLIHNSNDVPKIFIADYLIFTKANKCPITNTLFTFSYSSRKASVGGMRLILRAGI